MSYISRIKGNQTIKFRLMIEYSKNSNFPQNLAENEVRRLVPDLLLFFRKALYEAKSIGLQLSFNIFRESPIWQKIQTNCTKL